LLRWFAAEAEDLPWRRTTDPYAVWVSEIMLQQTQVATVMPYFKRWMRALPDLSSLARAPLDRVLKFWEGLGYYKRARNLHRAAAEVVSHHAGRFPRDFSDVLALPGVGRYTAGAICSIAFNQPWPIVDGNVIRVLARVFGIAEPVSQGGTRRLFWELAGELVAVAPAAAKAFPRTPDRTSRERLSGARIGRQLVRRCPCGALNQAIMELGRRVCTPREPACGECPLNRVCVACQGGEPQRFPNLAKPAAAVRQRVVAMVIERRGRFLVRQRPAEGVNGGLWEFPNELLGPEEDAAGTLRTRWPQVEAGSLRPLVTVRHSIMNRRITLEAWLARPRVGARFARTDGGWVGWVELRGLAFPSAHRRVVAELDQARE
jgi:A/G-specific adenine glycosylase